MSPVDDLERGGILKHVFLRCAVEASHIDGSLADNVAESGEESEDEWNYFKGEGSEQQPAEPGDPDDRDEPPRSETPCQDNVSLIAIRQT